MLQKAMKSFLQRKRGIFNFSTIRIPLPETPLHRLPKNWFPDYTEAKCKDLIKYYKTMVTLRRMELAADGLYKSQEIRGFLHLYTGQEAVITGIEDVVTWDDPIITSYRDHCQAYTRGDNVTQILAELMGKRIGSTKGKGGSMHYYRKKSNFYGGHGIVGGQTSVGTGFAFALKYLGHKNCSIVMYGDGAANQGQLYEAQNMAKLWKLPVIYICENNIYGMGTSNERASANTDFFSRGDLIPGLRVDGMNVFHMRKAIELCKQYVLEHGPIILEAKTYRYHGHSMSDPGLTYRTREEVQNIRKTKDCIEYVKQLIVSNDIQTEDQLKQIEKEIKKEIENAVDVARKADLPDELELLTDVYKKNELYYIRNTEYVNSWLGGGKVKF